MGNYTDKVRRYFRFSSSELRGLVITILLIGFMWGFNDGKDEFVFRSYLAHMVLSILFAAVAVLVKESAHKLVALSAGYRVEFQMWWYGLLLALAICFVSRGYIPIIIAGGFMLHHIAIHRLGFFRYGTNTLDLGMIALMGPLANVVFATMAKTFDLVLGLNNPVIDEFFRFSLVFAMVNLLPIPPLAGSKLFFMARIAYFFVFGFFAVYVLLIYALQVYSWIFGLIGAIAVVSIYYFKYEKEAY